MFLCYHPVMDKQSLTSLILLLVFFFVVPSVLKFLGRYTLSSKGEQRKEEDTGETRTPGEVIPGHPEVFHPGNGLHDAERLIVSNEPINPKWF